MRQVGLAPLARPGLRSWPVVGPLLSLWELTTDPVGLVDRFRLAYPGAFTVKIPFGLAPPLTFLEGRAAYRAVLDLDPSIGANGPVMQRVAALGRWFPRSRRGPEHLQALLLSGRRLVGDLLHDPTRLPSMQAWIAAAGTRHLEGWPAAVDLSMALPTLFHDAAAGATIGPELWESVRDEAGPWLRQVVHGVDARRVALLESPFGLLSRDRRAVSALHGILSRGLASPAGDALRPRLAARAAEADHPWLVFFALWNAMLYTGTYGFWAFVDLVRHGVSTISAGEAYMALLETLRLDPIAWQVRALTRELDINVGDRSYRIPAGHLLTVSSRGPNRDPDAYTNPDAWDPTRYARGEPAPLVFGRGPFACVAQSFLSTLVGTIYPLLLENNAWTLIDPIPRRIPRVHLLYPNRPLRALRGVRVKQLGSTS